MPRVTIVTAAKNAAAFLPSAIESMRDQTFRDWTHVIVDDASTDATTAIAEAASEADPRVQVVRLESSIGAYAAANVAALKADSAYIARLDADDIADPTRLAKQLDALERNPQAAANVTGWRQIDEKGVVDTRHTFALPTTSNEIVKWMLWLRGGPLHSSLMIDTAYFQARGGYGPERVAEDHRLWCALAREGRMSMLDEPLLYYRLHGQQITANKATYDDPARLGIRVEHFQKCGAGPEWTMDDARDLIRIARWDVPSFGVSRAFDLLDRWNAEWRRDPALTPEHRNELAARSARMRVLHTLRAAKARQAGLLRGLVSDAPHLAASTARVAVARPGSWLND
jgi:glycosyltransferase involved in cell wall biosynthesis